MVEQLIRGLSGPIGGDIHYTRRAVPNHHRALIANSKLSNGLKADPVPCAGHTVVCRFVRAVRFRPDDTVARMLFAKFLQEKQREDEALAKMRHVAAHAEGNAFTIYNMGLLHFEMGEAQLALERALEALALGFPRTELKGELVAAGKWIERAPIAAASGAASGTSAAGGVR